MANKKMSQTNVRKLTKLGKKSFGVTLPIAAVRKLGWRERQKLTVKKVKGGMVVRDWKKK